MEILLYFPWILLCIPSGIDICVREGSKITADGDCSHEIKRRLLLGRKVVTNLDSIFKDITLPTKVRLVKIWFFQWSCMDVRVGL